MSFASESHALAVRAVVSPKQGPVPAGFLGDGLYVESVGDPDRLSIVVDGDEGQERPVDGVAEAVFFLDVGIHADLAGGFSDIGHARDENDDVPKVRAALEGKVVDGGGCHVEAGVPHRARAGHLIDPGKELAAEKSSRGVDVLVTDNKHILYLRKLDRSLRARIPRAVIRTHIA